MGLKGGKVARFESGNDLIPGVSSESPLISRGPDYRQASLKQKKAADPRRLNPMAKLLSFPFVKLSTVAVGIMSVFSDF